MQLKKNYFQSPLPFMGQKRKFIKDVKTILSHYKDDITIVDLFGGSGLLSHTAKQEKPLAKVVYNDFDNYSRRLKTIPQTNELLAKIRELTKELPRDKMIAKNIKEAILELVKAHEEKYGFVDYITLSSSLLFSMKYVTNFDELTKQTFYNVVRQNEFNADGYLEGVEVVSKDYKELFQDYKDTPNVLFLVDPPYLSTEVGTYTMTWGLKEYLDVLSILVNRDYIYFTSNKSQILELCEWMGENKDNCNPFAHATQVKVNTTMNYNAKYTDIMVYKKH